MTKAAYQGKSSFEAYGSRKMSLSWLENVAEEQGGGGRMGREAGMVAGELRVHILNRKKEEQSELEMSPGFESPPLVTYFLKEGHMTQTSHK